MYNAARNEARRSHFVEWNMTLILNILQELDATIKLHQQEFNAIHTRFDSINEQLLRNMTIASDHSKQFTHLENQVNEMNEALKILLQRTEAPSDNQTNINTRGVPQTALQTSYKRNQHYNHQEPLDEPDLTALETPRGLGSMSVASTSSQSRTSLESVPITSPEKKRIRQTTYNTTTISPSDEQDSSAQYEDSTPADSDL